MDIASGEKPLDIFISCSDEDEDFLVQLKKHLAPLLRQRIITTYHHQDISPGMECRPEVETRLNSADIVLLLVSSSFIASDYCYSTEMVQAIKRHEYGEVRVIPIILRPVNWNETPFSKLEKLPKGRDYIQQYNQHEQEETFAEVASDIQKVIQSLLEAKLKRGVYNQEKKNMPLTPSPLSYVRNGLMQGTQNQLSYTNPHSKEPFPTIETQPRIRAAHARLVPLNADRYEGNSHSSDQCITPGPLLDESLPPTKRTSPLSISKRKFLFAMGTTTLAGMVCGVVGSEVLVPTILQWSHNQSSPPINMILTYRDLPTGVDVKELEGSLSDSFKRDFTITIGESYEGAVKQFGERQYNLLWASDFAYVLTAAKYSNATPILIRQNRTSDHLWYYSHILTKSNSGIKSLKDLRGRSLHIASRYSTSGYLYPRYMLQNVGLRMEDNSQVPTTITGSHLNSLNDLFVGAADACAVSSDIYKSRDGAYMSEEYRRLLYTYHLDDEKDIVSIAPEVTYANPIPMGPMVVHQDDRDVSYLQSSFFQLDSATLESLGLSGFGSVTDTMYNPIRDVASKMNIDLKTY